MKKNKKSKLLLIAASLMLVSITTIGLSYAYLSAVTNDKTNVFTPMEVVWEEIPEPTVQGETNEVFETDKAEAFTPNMQITKQPKVKNTSYTMLNKKDENGNVIEEGGEIVKEKTAVYAFVGVKVDYYVRIADKWERVSKEELAKFVTIDAPNVGSGVTPTSQSSQDKWFDITSDSVFTDSLAAETNNTLHDGTKSSYYVYGKSLVGAGVQSDSTATPKPVSTGGETVALYNKVTINGNLSIDPVNGADMTLADLASATPLAKSYKNFEFDIVLTAYGLLRDTTWTKEIAQNESDHPTTSGASAVFGAKFAAIADADNAAAVAYEEWSYSD